MVLDNCVIVLLKEMYLKSLIQEKNTQIATTLLLVFDLETEGIGQDNSRLHGN